MIPVSNLIILQNFSPSIYFNFFSPSQLGQYAENKEYLKNQMKFCNSSMEHYSYMMPQHHQCYQMIGQFVPREINFSNFQMNSDNVVSERINVQKQIFIQDLKPIQNITLDPAVPHNSDYVGDNNFNQQQSQQNYKPIRKKSETKNLIKNYGRALLTFIIKSSQFRSKVLKHCNINQDQFLEIVYSFREYIHTISAIRYLWQNHPFSKAFRILGCQYLRKHNLQHVFNSRIFKHGIYLKYQRKLMKSMENPNKFQSLKQA